jgi:hypothetical protein
LADIQRLITWLCIFGSGYNRCLDTHRFDVPMLASGAMADTCKAAVGRTSTQHLNPGLHRRACWTSYLQATWMGRTVTPGFHQRAPSSVTRTGAFWRSSSPRGVSRARARSEDALPQALEEAQIVYKVLASSPPDFDWVGTSQSLCGQSADRLWRCKVWTGSLS